MLLVRQLKIACPWVTGPHGCLSGCAAKITIISFIRAVKLASLETPYMACSADFKNQHSGERPASRHPSNESSKSPT